MDIYVEFSVWVGWARDFGVLYFRLEEATERVLIPHAAVRFYVL
jgi:hypothetical protein